MFFVAKEDYDIMLLLSVELGDVRDTRDISLSFFCGNVFLGNDTD